VRQGAETMLNMLEAASDVPHIPVNPKFISTVAHECVKAPEQRGFNVVKSG
jgi:hypothetical protein